MRGEGRAIFPNCCIVATYLKNHEFVGSISPREREFFPTSCVAAYSTIAEPREANPAAFQLGIRLTVKRKGAERALDELLEFLQRVQRSEGEETYVRNAGIKLSDVSLLCRNLGKGGAV